MSKNHRGTGLRSLPANGRGICPICKKSDIKVIYEVEVDGQKVKVCKYCNAALKNKAKKNTPAKEGAPAADTAETPAQ
jgi:ribosome-binding protein aMBF1 (putative translation factor)